MLLLLASAAAQAPLEPPSLLEKTACRFWPRPGRRCLWLHPQLTAYAEALEAAKALPAVTDRVNVSLVPFHSKNPPMSLPSPDCAHLTECIRSHSFLDGNLISRKLANTSEDLR